MPFSPEVTDYLSKPSTKHEETPLWVVGQEEIIETAPKYRLSPLGVCALIIIEEAMNLRGRGEPMWWLEKGGWK